jgi:signal transduction histidine kinase/ActR/RegA family two-component response regulator
MDEEEEQLRGVALRNAESILAVRRRAEAEILAAKEDLERATEELREQRESFREQAGILELLNETGAAIAAEIDLKTLVQTVTDAATKLSGARFGAFFYNVVDQRGESFLLYTLSGAPREAFEKFGLPRNTPLFDPTFRGQGIVRSADITKDHRYGTMSPHHGMPSGHLPLRSYLAVPVISRSGEVIGGLFFGHPDTNVFTDRAERLVVGVAAQAATAIDNARLYEAAQEEIARREQAEAALREVDRRKDEFLATLGHELRNPLAPIRHAAMISNAPTATEAQKRWSHDVIARQVHHMSLLLDDLLDVSRITRGQLRLRKERTELSSVVDATVETVRPSLDAKRQELVIHMPREPIHLAADPLRLAQVLSNLLANAAKYTEPDGQIRLMARRERDTAVIEVIDSGIGIAAEALPEVFQMFSQVKPTHDRSDGGLGIGLALAKGLVELPGGEIAARSEGPGRGSTFTVRLPIGAMSLPTDLGAPIGLIESVAVRRRVLVADDNYDSADSLATLLRLEGHEVKVVHDGDQALAAFGTFVPDFALLDIGMPGLNGYRVAQVVREAPSESSVVLIAVSGWGTQSDKAQALASGFNYHLTKPVEPERLLDLLRAPRDRPSA